MRKAKVVSDEPQGVMAVPRWVLSDPRMDWNMRKVALLLIYHLSTGEDWPSRDDATAMLEMSPSNYQKATEELKSMGVIEVVLNEEEKQASIRLNLFRGEQTHEGERFRGEQVNRYEPTNRKDSRTKEIELRRAAREKKWQAQQEEKRKKDEQKGISRKLLNVPQSEPEGQTTLDLSAQVGSGKRREEIVDRKVRDLIMEERADPLKNAVGRYKQEFAESLGRLPEEGSWMIQGKHLKNLAMRQGADAFVGALRFFLADSKVRGHNIYKFRTGFERYRALWEEKEKKRSNVMKNGVKPPEDWE